MRSRGIRGLTGNPKEIPTPKRVSFSARHLDRVTAAMADRSKIIEENPIGKGLDAFRASFNSICEGSNVLRSPDALAQLDRNGMGSKIRYGVLL